MEDIVFDQLTGTGRRTPTSPPRTHARTIEISWSPVLLGFWVAALRYEGQGAREHLGGHFHTVSRASFEARQLWGRNLPVRVVRGVGPVSSAI